MTTHALSPESTRNDAAAGPSLQGIRRQVKPEAASAVSPERDDLHCFNKHRACPHCGQGQCQCPTRLTGNCPAVAMRRDHYNGRALLWASGITLLTAAIIIFSLTSRAEEKPLELGGSVAVIALDQFGDHAAAHSASTAPPLPPPQTEPEPEPEPVRQPKPEVKKMVEEPHAPPVVKKEKERRLKPEPAERRHEKREHPRRERADNAQRRERPQPSEVQAIGGRRGGYPQAGKVMVFGRDNHPVLLKIKQAIDGNLLYPRRARMMREEGAAIVQFTWTASGQLKKVRLLRSTGSRELDEAAVQTIVRASASFPSVSHNFTLRLPIIFRLTN